MSRSRNKKKLPQSRNRNETTSLAQDKREVSVSTRELREFRGPIPPPEIIERYEATLPGAADRILSMAEKDQEISAKAQENFAKNDRLRINSSTWLGIGLLLVAGLAIWEGYPIAAIPLGLAGLITTIIREFIRWFRGKG